jgi:hypothetical protein
MGRGGGSDPTPGGGGKGGGLARLALELSVGR